MSENITNKELKLLKEGRPFGKSLEILKRMSNNVAIDLQILPEETVLNYEISILLYLQMYRTIKSKGLNLSESDLKIFYNLPLFLNRDFIISWENENVWESENFEDGLILYYKDIIKSKHPSEAYLPIEKPEYIKIWNYFFSKNENYIESILIYSYKVFLEYRKERPVYFKDEKFKNIKKYCGLIKSNSEDILFWIHSLFNFKMNHSKDLISRMIEVCDYNSYQFFEHLNKILSHFNTEEKDLKRLFNKDSLLVKTNLLDHLKLNNEDYDIYFDNKNVAENLWCNMHGNNLISIGSKPCKDIITNIVDYYDNKSVNEIDLENWDYLPIVKECDFKLVKGDSIKLLLTGKNGTGKQTLALSLLKNNGFKVFKISAQQIKDNKLKSILNILEYIEKSALLIDFDGTSCINEIQQAKIPVLVINGEENKINTSLKIAFDYIINTSDIPFRVRLNYAKRKIDNENLAIRVAQQIKNFSDIEKISRLISTEEEWDRINAHIVTYDTPQNDFCDVINYNKIQDVSEFVGYDSIYSYFNIIYDFFKNPVKYEKISASAPKGFIISGSPGTGKTIFVQNIAKKIKLPLLSVRSSILVDNPDKIKEVFDLARESTPCILFFDEIDSLLMDPVNPFGSFDTKKQNILNSMLTEMDGVNGLSGVMILGTTNNADSISSASKRSGRLSETIVIDLPNLDDRKAIWSKYLKDKKVTGEIDVNSLADSTLGFTGADISETINQACLYAINENKGVPDYCDIDKACEIVLWGRGNERVKMTEDAIFKVSVHETGHAIMAFKNNKKVNRVTIIPRQNALGVTHIIGDENIFSETKKSLSERIEILLGGILAEKVIFGEYESGGTSDLKKVTNLVDHYFLKCGFSEIIGLMNGGDKNSWSENKKNRFEEECLNFISKIAHNVENWLKSNKEMLKKYSMELNEKKSLSSHEISHWKEEIENIEETGNHE